MVRETTQGSSIIESTKSKESEKTIEDMPIAINPNRPPSTSSNASGSAPRTTATSRRGGRNRARSPAVMGNRLQGTSESGGPNGDNPSSAAAAAAAAAKAFSNNAANRNPVSWPEGGTREDPSYHSSNWPEDGHGPNGRSHRYHGGYGDRYQQGGNGPFRSVEEAASYHDRRYRDHRGRHYEGERSPHQSRAAHAGYYPPDYRQSQGRASPRNHRGGGTSLVIGGATPIHLPKREDMSEPERSSRGGSAASVFRGRPNDDGRAGPQDEDSPQKILLSLRTPTMSFEEKPEKGDKTSGLTLSPDDPPQIQNSHQQRPADVFERTPEGVKNTSSIDMAPSFNLFNQSFDSLGDVQFNMDATLQNDSFGMARTASMENDGTAQLLQRNPSGGNFSAQLLAPSGSGALTIGYSPVNSFGHTPSAMPPRRSGNMMVLGDPDPRATSPTQLLGMYRSYSGGAPRPQGPLDDSHMRMSVGSFGGQSMSQPRPYEHLGASPNYYYSMGPARSHESADKGPPFYVFLRKYKAAFKDCSFLLPGLKAALLEAPLSEDKDANVSNPATVENGGSKWGNGVKPLPGQPHFMGPGGQSIYSEPSPQDIAVARRRVESSVCAFGGGLNKVRAMQSRAKEDSKASIFRGKDEPKKEESATVTPQSSTGSPKGSRFQSRSRMKYEEELPGRYYENESRLSWEFEESPPVDISRDGEPEAEKNDRDQNASKDDSDMKDDDAKSESDNYCKPIGDQEVGGKRVSNASPQPKMRYRCKLCGQPKQNHTCPYQQSLARSIGVMIYPSVNAFAAAEPGVIAPALSDMNNFVDTQKESSSNESSPNRPTPDRIRRMTTGSSVPSTNQVTPESMRSSPRQVNSPSSLMVGTPVRHSGRRSGGSRRSSPKKRSHSQMGGSDDHSDLLFMESMEIKPEQFRIVSETVSLSTPDSYNYPALPLPYAQRKRLSDNLFSLSNEVPKLTDECAQVLREAREKDMWDLAVSELMTQVVTIIHCPDGDHRFEGLRQYLLTLGIAC